MNIEYISSLFEFAGGIGMFLYGMNTMADGMQRSAGGKMKKLLGYLTSNRLLAIIVGAVITAIIQSSGATTVMVVGFVNAGLMTLVQAVGVIMGANIGTTITAWIVSLGQLGDAAKVMNPSFYAPFLIGIGAFVILFSKKDKVKNAGEIIVGIGLLFEGLTFMSSSIAPYTDAPIFSQAFQIVGSNPFLGILIGIIAGYIICAVLGMVLPTTAVTADGVEYTKAWILNWDKVAQAKWFAVPQLMPVKPVFDLRAILPVMIMFIVTAVETVGDISGCIEGGLGREATDSELAGGVMCDGLGSSFAALFGVLPNTSFSQNVGLVTMTQVINRFAILMGAFILILSSLFPPLGAFFNSLPQAVLGGCTVMMFGSIMYEGIKMLKECEFDDRTMVIVSLAFAIGVGLTQTSGNFFSAFPHEVGDIFNGNAVAGVFVVSLLLSLFLPKKKK